MSETERVKVFCSRNHRVGTVCTDSDGLLLRYSAEVWDTGALFGAPAVDRLPDGVAMVLGGYCAACKRAVVLDTRLLREAYAAGRGDIHVGDADSADRQWTRAGQPPIYPRDTPRHKTDPRELP